jgi:hypothetical protein
MRIAYAIAFAGTLLAATPVLAADADWARAD